MADTPRARFLARLRELGLADATTLAELGDAPPNQDARRLADGLVWAGKLTTWQADCLLAGRLDGLRFGPWTLIDRVSAGDEGERFRARPNTGGPESLLTRWPAGRLERPGAAELMSRETKASALLRHPNLASLREAGQCDGRAFTAREWPGGFDLGTRLRQSGTLPTAFAADCVRQAALGLHQAHQAGLVHRAIRADYLFVAGLTPAGPLPETPAVALAGLGESALVADAPARPSGTAAGLTLPTRAEIQADLTALGGVLYDLIAGPAPGRPLGRLPDILPAGLRELIGRVLDDRREGRPATAAALAETLAEFSGRPDSAVGIGAALPPMAEGVSLVGSPSRVALGEMPPLAEGVSLIGAGSDIMARSAGVPLAESASGVLGGFVAPPLAESASFVGGHEVTEGPPMAEGASHVGPIETADLPVAMPPAIPVSVPTPVPSPLPLAELPIAGSPLLVPVPEGEAPPPLPVWEPGAEAMPTTDESPENGWLGGDDPPIDPSAPPIRRSREDDDDSGGSWLFYTIGGFILHGTALVIVVGVCLWWNGLILKDSSHDEGSTAKPKGRPAKPIDPKELNK